MVKLDLENRIYVPLGFGKQPAEARRPARILSLEKGILSFTDVPLEGVEVF